MKPASTAHTKNWLRADASPEQQIGPSPTQRVQKLLLPQTLTSIPNTEPIEALYVGCFGCSGKGGTNSRSERIWPQRGSHIGDPPRQFSSPLVWSLILARIPTYIYIHVYIYIWLQERMGAYLGCDKWNQTNDKGELTSAGA